MDFQKLIDRVKNILLSPKTEWPVIAAEPATVKGIFTQYVMILAAIPAVFGFLAMARLSVAAGLVLGVVSYAVACGSIYLLGFLINAFAANFGGEKNEVQAMKSAAYSYTANAIAAIGGIIPILGMLIGLAGLIYGIYLLFLGLPHTMKCPPERAGGYAAVTLIIAWVVAFIVNMIVAGIVVAGIIGTAALAGAH